MGRSLKGWTKFFSKNLLSQLKREFESDFPDYLETSMHDPMTLEASSSLRNITMPIEMDYEDLDAEGYPVLTIRYRIHVSEDGRGMGQQYKRGKFRVTGNDHPNAVRGILVGEMVDKIGQVVEEVPRWRISARRCRACRVK